MRKMHTVLGDMPICEATIEMLNNALWNTYMEKLTAMEPKEICEKLEALREKPTKDWTLCDHTFASVGSELYLTMLQKVIKDDEEKLSGTNPEQELEKQFK